MCRYNMTRFAMMLNEITPPGLERKLAPTDCRLRPDQHALEEGIYDQVSPVHLHLPHKQSNHFLALMKVKQAGFL